MSDTSASDTDRRAVELTGDVMYYCPPCEVLLGQDEAYEHTYSHRERGPNTGAVMDSFKQIPIAEPTTGPWNDEREEKRHQDWRCTNCGSRPRLKHEDEPEKECRHCGCDEWYVHTETDRNGGESA